MARVNVEQKALTDPRFYRLGVDLGAPPEYAQAFGLFTMVQVWNECIERGRYTLDHWLIDAVTRSPSTFEKIIRADLGARAGTGRIRIKGTKGRVEYLEGCRRIGRNSGHLGAEHGKKGGRPRGESKNPPGGVSETPVGGLSKNPLPAPAPAPAPALKTEENTETTPTPPLAVVPIVPAADFLAAWNNAAAEAGWVVCRNLSAKRLKALRARQADAFWRDHWREAIDRAKPIPGLRGSNDRNWRANVDWFLRPETVTRITEGFYDHWQPARDRTRAGSATEYAKRTLGGIL